MCGAVDNACSDWRRRDVGGWSIMAMSAGMESRGPGFKALSYKYILYDICHVPRVFRYYQVNSLLVGG